MRGDRLTFQNLAVNPGFEQPSTAGVNVFNDTFANVNAYTVVSGGAPSVAANVMTVAANSIVSFGRPGWGSLNTWQVRFQFNASQVVNFWLHFVNASNGVFVSVATGSIGLNQIVAGVNHVLASAGPTYVAGNFYWMKATMYPAAPGEVADVEVQIFNDSAGAVGTALASAHLGPVPTFDAVTA